MSAQDRETGALEALIVSRLRLGSAETIDITKLPTLTESEKASLKCLKPGFIQSIIENADLPDLSEDATDSCFEVDNVENRELILGLNRAEDIDPVTEEELERRRREMQDKMREDEDGGRDRKDG